MKHQSTILRISLVTLFLVSVLGAKAQDISTPDQLTEVTGADAGAKSNAIFCFEGDSFTLTATTDAGNGQTFETFKWERQHYDGTLEELPGTTNILTNTAGLEPGYYTFYVTGNVANDAGANPDVICSADPETFTVYVLPPLNVTLSVAGNNGNLLYCENDLPEDLVLSANVVKDPAHDVPETFTYKYQWYKASGTDAAQPISSATSATYTINEANDAAAGSFKYSLVVSLEVKDTCSYNSLDSATEGSVDIIVTPKPGKPTITITPNP